MNTTPPDTLRTTAQEGIRALLELVGDDPNRAGLVDTPRRVVDAFLENTSAPGKPADLLARVFTDTPPSGPVTLGPIEYASTCEHHLMPFTGHVWITYQPDENRVVGLSKLARLVEHHSKQLQMQERMTTAIADSLDTHLTPRGVGVTVQGAHTCMATRGAVKPSAIMTTTATRGCITHPPDPHARATTTDL